MATKYAVSELWVRRLKQRRRETGEVAPRRAGSRRESKWRAHADYLQQLVAERPDATLQELRDELGVALSTTTLWRALRALQLTFKKGLPCCGAGSAGCPRAASALVSRNDRAGSAAAGIHRRNVGCYEHESPLRPQSSRSAVGRQSAARPLEDNYFRGSPSSGRPDSADGCRRRWTARSSWRISSNNWFPYFILATSSSWITSPRTMSPESARRSRVLVRKWSICRLTVRTLTPSNWCKLKWLARSAAERTIDGLWTFLGRVLDHFPPDECSRYFQHCGYATKS